MFAHWCRGFVFSMRLDDDDGDEEIAGSDGRKYRHGEEKVVWRGRRRNGVAGSIDDGPTGLSMSGTATVADDGCGKERRQRWRRRDDGGRRRRRRWQARVHDTGSRGRLHDAQECSRTRAEH